MGILGLQIWLPWETRVYYYYWVGGWEGFIGRGPELEGCWGPFLWPFPSGAWALI